MSLVNVNPSKIVATNLLSVGFHMDHSRWTDLRKDTIKQYAKDLNPTIVRAFDFRTSLPALRPCIQWDEATKTGTWDWTNIDEFVNYIFAVGAEPLFCLSWARDPQANYLPSGMAVNPATLLPYPDSFATYATEWVKHFKQTGKPVRFYEIFNEPGGYFNNGVHTFDENLSYFIEVWRATTQAMRTENPSIFLSHDLTESYSVLIRWINQNGPEIDSINFHKYDDGGTLPGRTDAQNFSRAESQHFSSSPYGWSVKEAQAYYLAQRERQILILDTESNLNSTWEQGTDPRLQQMAGGVWLALSLRTAMLSNVNCNIYFELTSNKAWELSAKPSGGWGFGMIDGPTMTRWIPYYVYRMFGKNLAVGDSIVEATTNDPDLRAIAWVHGEMLNIFLINKSHISKQVAILGITANLDYTKLDESTDTANPTLQTGLYPSSNVLLNGYTVMLLQTPKTQVKFLFSHWQDGDTNPTKTVNL